MMKKICQKQIKKKEDVLQNPSRTISVKKCDLLPRSFFLFYLHMKETSAKVTDSAF